MFTNPIKRKLIQIATFGMTNAKIGNFAKGTIDKGILKGACVPGLNCYSCPGAIASCPIGSLQAVIGSFKYDFSFYVVGILLAFGIVFGRLICGFLCPFGLIQEVIHKIPSPKIKLHNYFNYVKYVILIVFVIIMPIFFTNFMGMGQPAFCQFICPAGTLEGGIPLLLGNSNLRNSIGWLFSLKASILLLTVIGCVFIYRIFCRTLCPLGAIYSLFNKFSFYQMQVDKEKCVNCGICTKVCKMGVHPSEKPDALECIRCGDCINACPKNALKASFGFKYNKINESKSSELVCENSCGRCSEK